MVAKIEDFRKILADNAKPKLERRNALRFLVHFVQDVHQPVHVGCLDDRGGNDLQVQFFGEPSNLHRVWDYGLFERESKDEDHWTKRTSEMLTDEKRKAWAAENVDEWAEESLAAARKAYLIPDSDERLKSGVKIGEDYMKANLPVAKERLAIATSRLVDELNAIWP